MQKVDSRSDFDEYAAEACEVNVVFGPASSNDQLATAGSPPAKIDEHVQTVTHDLVSDLMIAERRTVGWTDRELAYALVEIALSRCMRRLAATGVWGRANQLLSAELWKIAGPLLTRGWMQERARTKPCGYAGDYLMLARICERFACADPLGCLFDRYFQSQLAVEAVRSRTEQIGGALAAHRLDKPGDDYRVLSVGSGPALDMQQAVRLMPSALRQGVTLTLADLDPDALDYARLGLSSVLRPAQIVCMRENLFRLTEKSGSLRDEQDFIVCSGLFDYLPDAAAASLLRLFWQRLRSGGSLLVGNFARHPSRAYMEWLGNWYLIYRTAEEMARLSTAAEIPAGCAEIGAERTGLDLFLVAQKP